MQSTADGFWITQEGGYVPLRSASNAELLSRHEQIDLEKIERRKGQYDTRDLEEEQSRLFAEVKRRLLKVGGL